MHEQTKLEEAKYFYSLMVADYNDRQKFNFDFSAFLSPARSVLQYSLDEAKSITGGQAWYDKRISESRTLTFFKGKRDVNIHVEPVKPSMNVSAVVIEKIGISDSATVILRDSQGNIKYQATTATPKDETRTQIDKNQPNITFRYFFSDWKGKEDLMTLCQMYLEELQSFVDDGILRSFLTK